MTRAVPIFSISMRFGGIKWLQTAALLPSSPPNENKKTPFKKKRGHYLHIYCSNSTNKSTQLLKK